MTERMFKIQQQWEKIEKLKKELNDELELRVDSLEDLYLLPVVSTPPEDLTADKKKEFRNLNDRLTKLHQRGFVLDINKILFQKQTQSVRFPNIFLMEYLDELLQDVVKKVAHFKNLARTLKADGTELIHDTIGTFLEHILEEFLGDLKEMYRRSSESGEVISIAAFPKQRVKYTVTNLEHKISVWFTCPQKEHCTKTTCEIQDHWFEILNYIINTYIRPLLSPRITMLDPQSYKNEECPECGIGCPFDIILDKR